MENSNYDDDDDFKSLQNGMILKKLNSKLKFKNRFYRIDFANHQLIANSKEFRKKHKYYPLGSIDEVKIGPSSDNFKEYHLKECLSSDMEKRAFVIFYSNHNKTLELVAPSQAQRDVWVKVLDHFITLRRHKGGLPETHKTTDFYFKAADKSNDNALSKDEIKSFLESINLKIEKDHLRKLLESTDVDGDGVLSKEEFEKFMERLSNGIDMMNLFKLVCDKNTMGSNSIPEYITLEQFQKFLKVHQKESKTDDECKQLILEFEPTDYKFQNKFTLVGFTMYLKSINQHLMDYNSMRNVYQDMHRPIKDYFIYSTHNTYLSGDQLQSDSKVQCYISVLMKHCRLLELDCHDGSDGVPVVFHKYTLTSKIRFEDVIKAVKEYAFKVSDYPVILTLENHCTPPQQKLMAQYLERHLSEFLYREPLDENNPPLLKDLKRKVLIRGKARRKSNEIAQLLRNELNDEDDDDDDDDDDEDDEDTDDDNNTKKSDKPKASKNIVELSDLITLFQLVSFKGFDYGYENYKYYEGSSIAEKKGIKLVEDQPVSCINYTNHFVIKVYPAGWRTDSTNLNPILFWNCGFQIVALNMQSKDTEVALNQALFNDNGRCGYVLKPKILRDPSLGFNPYDVKTMKNKKYLEIVVISAQNLPSPKLNELIRDVIDPFVVINIFGVPDDENEATTKHVKDNGYNPIWNESFKFVINCPELAFVKFTVLDKDISLNDPIGEYTIRFENMREGFRYMKLKNKLCKGTLFVCIKIKPLTL